MCRLKPLQGCQRKGEASLSLNLTRLFKCMSAFIYQASKAPFVAQILDPFKVTSSITICPNNGCFICS